MQTGVISLPLNMYIIHNFVLSAFYNFASNYLSEREIVMLKQNVYETDHEMHQLQ
jgi:uncharacterized protein (DUF1778 family)